LIYFFSCCTSTMTMELIIYLTGRGKCIHIWDSSNSNSIFSNLFSFPSHPNFFLLLPVILFLFVCAFWEVGERMNGMHIHLLWENERRKGLERKVLRQTWKEIIIMRGGYALLFFSHRGEGSLDYFFGISYPK